MACNVLQGSVLGLLLFVLLVSMNEANTMGHTPLLGSAEEQGDFVKSSPKILVVDSVG